MKLDFESFTGNGLQVPGNRTAEAPISGRLDGLSDPPSWRGNVDYLTDLSISGWIISADNPTKAITLECRVLGLPVLRTVTQHDRKAISQALMLPVRAGFRFDFADMDSDVARGAMQALRSAREKSLSVEEVFDIVIFGTDISVPFYGTLSAQSVDLDALTDIPQVASELSETTTSVGR